MAEYKNRLEIIKETPNYWRVVISNGELNLFEYLKAATMTFL